MQNPDILAELSADRARADQVVVGFAAETGDEHAGVLEHARAKLARKGCDLLVVNDVSGGKVFGSTENEAVVLDASGGDHRRSEGLQVRPRARGLGPGGVQVADLLRSPWVPLVRVAGSSIDTRGTAQAGEHTVTGRLFTSESVTEGHPDKIADQISDTILDALLAQDPHSRVAVETLVTTGLVVVAGEVTTSAYAPIAQLARDKILEIGYDSSEKGFDGASCGVQVAIGAQSADIAQGVDDAYEERHDHSVDPLDRQGAGDQGIMFGYACDDTPTLMPLPITIAHRLSERLAEVRKDGTLPYLRPDGKTQVTIEYDDEDRPVRIDTVVAVHPARPRHRPGQHADPRHQAARGRPRARRRSTSPPTTTGCWSTPPAGSRSAARWATPD